jgi:hypothetical protein
MADERLVYTVVLEKHDGTLGPAPIGSIRTINLREGRAAPEAVSRAFQILKRDEPGENPMCWRVRD